eukprot:Blabericola_migrator_1__10180@NODE_568_length_7541_cov_61_527562_g423_i0_p6_GENE_NODE_568_length_7541_cov_61_527562_g423_i0NODE_568_length_7541_cov_61_527562_g423_i0_p6_ORF_typecomplete_len113_score13_03SortilinVps10/PF15902_5/1_9e05PSII_BNR/PF14870_6/0_0036_NODE_568_length_7541_cov_61_527562_g423_i0324662
MYILSLLLSCLTLSTAKKVDVTHSLFESPILDIQWLTKNATTVMVLTTSGRVWRSLDSGRNFDDLSAKLPLSNFKLGPNETLTYDSVVVSTNEPKNAVLLSKREMHYVTSDG